MPLTLAALKTELTTDPETQGYAASETSPAGDVALINAAPKGAGAAYAQNITNLTSGQLLGAVDKDDYLALTDKQISGWNMIMTAAVSGVDLWDPEIEALMLAIWAVGTTRTNLTNLRTRDGSRAEELFGEGVVVTHHDVVEALRLP